MSPLTRFWRWLHVRSAAQQRRRTQSALTAAMEAQRVAEIIATAKAIAQAVMDGHAAAEAEKAGPVNATHLRLRIVPLNGMACTYGLN